MDTDVPRDYEDLVDVDESILDTLQVTFSVLKRSISGETHVVIENVHKRFSLNGGTFDFIWANGKKKLLPGYHYLLLVTSTVLLEPVNKNGSNLSNTSVFELLKVPPLYNIILSNANAHLAQEPHPSVSSYTCGTDTGDIGHSYIRCKTPRKANLPRSSVNYTPWKGFAKTRTMSHRNISKVKNLDELLNHTITIPLPVSFIDLKACSKNFNLSSSPAVSTGLDSEAKFELAGSLFDQLNFDFDLKAHSRDPVPGALAELEGLGKNMKSGDTGIRVVIIGSSHFKRSLKFLKNMFYEIVEIMSKMSSILC